MMDEITYAADKFLAILLSQGLTLPEVEVHLDPNDIQAYLRTDSPEFVEKIDAEFKAERFDTTEVLDDVVIKKGHKYLYADDKWTYEIRLAKRFRWRDAERIVKHFDEGTEFVPAPPAAAHACL
jgi:hypothetical protein